MCGDNIQIYKDDIRIEMKYSEVKSCSLIFRYPTDEDGTKTYPGQVAIVEMKSTTIPKKLVGLLHKKMEAHMKSLS